MEGFASKKRDGTGTAVTSSIQTNKSSSAANPQQAKVKTKKDDEGKRNSDNNIAGGASENTGRSKLGKECVIDRGCNPCKRVGHYLGSNCPHCRRCYGMGHSTLDC